MAGKYCWLPTASGRRLNYLSIRPEDIDLGDICHSLTHIARFNGHTTRPITVAQHSMAVAYIAPQKYRLESLLHDAAEAYTGDIPSPMKAFLGERMRIVETALEKAIAAKFGLIYPLPAEVKRADMQALAYEATHFTPTGGWARDLYRDVYGEECPDHPEELLPLLEFYSPENESRRLEHEIMEALRMRREGKAG